MQHPVQNFLLFMRGNLFYAECKYLLRHAGPNRPYFMREACRLLITSEILNWDALEPHPEILTKN